MMNDKTRYTNKYSQIEDPDVTRYTTDSSIEDRE